MKTRKSILVFALVSLFTGIGVILVEQYLMEVQDYKKIPECWAPGKSSYCCYNCEGTEVLTKYCNGNVRELCVFPF